MYENYKKLINHGIRCQKQNFFHSNSNVSLSQRKYLRLLSKRTRTKENRTKCNFRLAPQLVVLGPHLLVLTGHFGFRCPYIFSTPSIVPALGLWSSYSVISGLKLSAKKSLHRVKCDKFTHRPWDIACKIFEEDVLIMICIVGSELCR